MNQPQLTTRIFRRRHLLVLCGVLLLLVATGVGCKNSKKAVGSLPQVDLALWTVWDEPEDYAQIIAEYRAQHPNVRITVKKVPYDEYEQALLEGWASGEGPDLFEIPNAAVGTYRNYISPMPASIELPELVTTGGCSKSVRLVTQKQQAPVPEQLDERFIPVVTDDVVFDNTIYALPLAADTLALFYNKDLLDAARIVAPPQTWQELVDMVDASKNTLKKEDKGDIVQAGAALGTANNIARAPDILSLLMMQSGAQMVDASGRSVTFQNGSVKEPDFNPGLSALTFYTSFATPSRVTYTWNEKQQDAQEAFAAGRVGFFIGYSYQAAIIKQQNPQLNLGIAPVPQISLDGPQLNYANYWVMSVAKKAAFSNEAWDFLLFAASPDRVQSYLTKTNKPTAIRSLIPTQQDDLTLKNFVNQLLIAKSWYHGNDYRAMERAMEDLVHDTLQGAETLEALSLAAQKIQQTLQPAP